MWGVVAAWVVCLASLSLPWPGVTLVVLLCCVAFFELASPAAAWVGKGRGHPPPSTIEEMSDKRKDTSAAAAGAPAAAAAAGGGVVARRRSPSAALAAAFHFLAGRLRSRAGSGGLEEVGVTAAGVGGSGDEGAPAADSKSSSAERPSASFLKGSVGSFSRGGLMVTHEGRVIYKVNQDRGLISHPSLNRARHTVFGVFDGHGENGEHVAAYTMREVPRRLELHPDAMNDPVSALEDVFLDINSSLPKSGINAVFGGCTAVVALVRGPRVWVANAGDSRAVVAGRGGDGVVVARGLTRDQNPDSPGERERIEAMGGFVSDPEEPGASARVWLDETRTLVGLAMARSIGDLAVKRVGVIALPEVTEYVLKPEDEFLVLASDGVWEFIDNQEAAEVVQGFFEKGEDAAGACKGLMELANRRWSDMVGDYRDDITATVVRLPFLPAAAAAEALAMHASTAESGGASATAGAAIAADRAEGAAATTVAASAAAAPQPAHPSAEEGGSKARASAPSGGEQPPAPRIGRSGGSDRDSDGDSGSNTVDEEKPSTARAAVEVGSVNSTPAVAEEEDENISAPSELMESGTCATNVARGEDGGGGGEGDGGLDGGETLDGRGDGGPSEEDVDLEEAEEENGHAEAVALAMAAVNSDLAEESETLTSTPAITPEDASEDKVEDHAGGEGGDDEGDDAQDDAQDDAHGDGGPDENKTRRVLSTIPEALAVRGNTPKATKKEAGGTAPAAAPAFLPMPSATAEAAAAAAAPVEGEVVPSHDGTSVIVSMTGDGDDEAEGDHESEENGEEWEWDFGARENREPSREIREASREFPSGSLDALVAGAPESASVRT